MNTIPMRITSFLARTATGIHSLYQQPTSACQFRRYRTNRAMSPHQIHLKEWANMFALDPPELVAYFVITHI
jgi:hypothetical protein